MILQRITRDKRPIPHLAERVAKQKSDGGRLILYRRAWSAVAITILQDRIEHVSIYDNRVLAGWRHNLFTILLGIWSPLGLLVVLQLLSLNLRGGIDVTARFSSSSIDPLHVLPPDLLQDERDHAKAQWTFVVIGLIIFLAVLYYYDMLGIQK